MASGLLAVRNRSRIEAFGLRQRSGAFTVCFPSWNDMLFVCARTLAELVGAWQPPFQKIKCFSGLFSCVPVLLHAILILIAPCFIIFKGFFVLSFTLLILHFLFLSLCHGRLAKCEIRLQRAKVQRADLLVLRRASARACGRRSFQYTWDS